MSIAFGARCQWLCLSSGVKPMKVLVSILAVAVLLNLASWTAFSITHGGNALNGKIEGDRYYVGSHSRYTEVSASQFQFSRWQTISNLIIMPVVVGGRLMYVYRTKGTLRVCSGSKPR